MSYNNLIIHDKYVLIFDIPIENLTVLPPGSDITDQTNDLLCIWSEGNIKRMEWLFLGEDRIVPMKYTNTSWDGAVFTCAAQLELTVKGICMV